MYDTRFVHTDCVSFDLNLYDELHNLLGRNELPIRNLIVARVLNFSYKEDISDNDWVVFATLSSHTSTVWSIAFDATGKRLASCSDDRTVKIWQEYLPGNEEGIECPNNEPAWKCVCTLSGYHSRAIYDISWNRQNGLIATAGGDDMVRIFRECPGSKKNEPTFELVVSQTAHGQDLNTVKWSPKDPNLLVTTSDDGDVKLWRFVDGESSGN